MARNNHGDIISPRDLRALLTLCQKLLARSHPATALMIAYAAKDLQKRKDFRENELKTRRDPKNGQRENDDGDRGKT